MLAFLRKFFDYKKKHLTTYTVKTKVVIGKYKMSAFIPIDAESKNEAIERVHNMINENVQVQVTGATSKKYRRSVT